MIGYLKLYPCVQVHARGKFYHNPHAFLVHITQKNIASIRLRYRCLCSKLPVSCAISVSPAIRTHICTLIACAAFERQIVHILFREKNRVHSQNPEFHISKVHISAFPSSAALCAECVAIGAFSRSARIFCIDLRFIHLPAAVLPLLSNQLTRAFFP